jgi:hypothetical protein
VTPLRWLWVAGRVKELDSEFLTKVVCLLEITLAAFILGAAWGVSKVTAIEPETPCEKRAREAREKRLKDTEND